MPAWIAGLRDKTELRGSGDKISRGLLVQPDRQQRPVRRSAQAARSSSHGGSGDFFEQACLGVAEGETDPAGKRAVAQRVRSGRVLGLGWRRADVQIICSVWIELRRG